MALAACPISTPLRDLEKPPAFPQIGHLDLSERERERQLDKYASLALVPRDAYRLMLHPQLTLQQVLSKRWY